MKTISLALIASLLSLASALPTDLKTRATGQVVICTGENSTGTCEAQQVEFNECIQLKAPYLNNVGSFSVAPGAFCRITYTADECTLHGDAFINPTPGAPTLHHFDDPATGANIDAGSTMTSFKCQQCTTCT
jgi:hypothetical protein